MSECQPIAGFMASVICGQTAEDRDQLRNPTLVWSMGLLYLLETKRVLILAVDLI